MLTQWKPMLAALCLAGLAAAPAQALNLWQAYEAALQNDPTYQSARYENEAGREYKVLGRSNLLPSMSASLSQSKNNLEYSSRSGTLNYPNYTSRSNNISVRQPILNLDGVARYRQGVAQSELSDATFLTRQKEMMLRVLSAYLDVLFAQDQIDRKSVV